MNHAATLPLSAGFGTPMPLLKQQRLSAEACAEAAAPGFMPPPAPALPQPSSRRRRPLALAAMVLVHLLLLWALANLNRVKEAVHEHAPLFVSFINDSATQATAAVPMQLPTPPAPQRPPAMTMDLPPPPVVANAISVEAAKPAPAAVAATAAESVRSAPVPAAAPATVVAAVVPAQPPAPAPVAAPAVPRQIPSAGVQFIEPPVVDYPKASKRNGEAGTVIVRAYIGPEGGAPRSVQLEQSCGFVRLDQAALAAVQRARFRSYSDNGRPVEGWALVPIQFELEK